jgi:hypothetical protein
MANVLITGIVAKTPPVYEIVTWLSSYRFPLSEKVDAATPLRKPKLTWAIDEVEISMNAVNTSIIEFFVFIILIF